jgi:DNA-binding response OmpR family regulator
LAIREVHPPPPPPLRFGVFQLDVRAGELRKAGVLVGLQDQSLKVLAELLERPGDLVTASSCASGCGQTAPFGDFEHDLKAVINRLRETMGDTASRIAC